MRYNKNVERNVGGRLKEALGSAEWELLQQAAEAAQQLRLPLYVVGGVPRDLILGGPISDLDLTVEGDAQALAKLLRSKYGGKLTLHGKFGTAKWESPDSRTVNPDAGLQNPTIDLITARWETYRHPAALPTVKPGTIGDDLRRRDFTINAIAIRLDEPYTGEVRDDFEGWKDIEAGIVRVLHGESFLDDPTRMYRAVRYEQRYGFQIAGETAALIPPARPVVGKLSAQRIRHELDLILDEPRAEAMLSRLAELDLLVPIHPALVYDRAAAQRLSRVAPDSFVSLPELPMLELRWLSWLMGLTQLEIKALNSRLHFEGALFRALLAAADLWAEVGGLAGSVPSRWVERLDLAPLISVYAVCLSSPAGQVRAALEEYLTRWRHIRPKTNGDDLKRLGVRPGAAYRKILGELRRAWLDGELSSEEQEDEYLQRLLERPPAK